ncbi:Calcium-binding protein 7 [Galemys pyrenaicus]|uniref:Calcium-binding protein 7 n=1 Tax=Galemys pyrenaicus TaxID=202257 RepID=A0A8J6ALF2_GALPY|nr:Calcium-binding protein 7 [Galemys pyrenaicus]
MPFHPVTAALMYRGIYTVPNLLSEQRPVDIPEDELEGECPPTPARPPRALLPVRPGGAGRGRGRGLPAGAGCRGIGARRGRRGRLAPRGPRRGSRRRRGGPAPARVVPALRKLAGPRSGVTGPRSPRWRCGNAVRHFGAGVPAAPLRPPAGSRSPVPSAVPAAARARIGIPLVWLLNPSARAVGAGERAVGRSQPLRGSPRPPSRRPFTALGDPRPRAPGRQPGRWWQQQVAR